MKVLHVSSRDAWGGAARAAYRLHRGLLRLGCDSRMFVAQRLRNDPTVTAFVPPKDPLSRLRRWVRRRQITRRARPYRMSRSTRYERFSDECSEYGDSLVPQLPVCDVVNLHWIAEFLDYRTFFAAVIPRIPIVWRLADMNSFTGGCHYDDGCSKFMAGCGACPQLGSTDPRDLSARIWRGKQAIYSHVASDGLHIVAPSRWMADQVKCSALLRGFQVAMIPSGVDTEEFAPRDRWVSRDALGIPCDANVVLFVATSLQNRRKGFELLVQALTRMDDMPKVWLVSVGRGNASTDLRIPHVHLGHIDDDRFLSMIYSAADLSVMPSLQEAFGQTVLESLACGTPIVGFAAGGIPDMVRPGVTGLLVPNQDVEALGTAISRLLKDPGLRAQMADNCRHIAVMEYALEIQAQRYNELYETILDVRTGCSAMKAR